MGDDPEKLDLDFVETGPSNDAHVLAEVLAHGFVPVATIAFNPKSGGSQWLWESDFLPVQETILMKFGFVLAVKIFHKKKSSATIKCLWYSGSEPYQQAILSSFPAQFMLFPPKLQ